MAFANDLASREFNTERPARRVGYEKRLPRSASLRPYRGLPELPIAHRDVVIIACGRVWRRAKTREC